VSAFVKKAHGRTPELGYFYSFTFGSWVVGDYQVTGLKQAMISYRNSRIVIGILERDAEP
jgi:hypothetical protein